MKTRIIKQNDIVITVIESGEVEITDVASALDLMATVRYETDCDCLIIPKEALVDEFFVLSTGIAGDILQKFVNYHFKIAIVGDFSVYTSKPLQDFIYECNNGNHIFFVRTEEEAIAKFLNVR